jgi:alpha-beta hydrolase superfamily lysophospholipase
LQGKTTTNLNLKIKEKHCQLHKENKIDKPIIVGHSMGGGLALAPQIIRTH